MSKIKNYIFITIIVILAFCLYGVPTFYAPDETRYSEVAREMIANHDFIVPYVNGIVFFHKPPLVYWIIDVFMSVFGQNTWGARLANPFLVLVCMLFVYFVVNKVLQSKVVALLSVIITLTTVLVLFVGRYLNIDMGIAVFLNLTMLSYWLSLKYDDDYKMSSFWLLMAFVFSGLAVMTKGLVGIVFPMAIVGLYSITMNEWRRLIDIRLYIGLFIVGIISLPWILLVDQQYPGFAYYYVVVQQILRYSTDEQSRDVSKIFYLLVFTGAFFPWFGFLPQAFKEFFSKAGFKNRKQNKNSWFLFIWGTFIFVFFGVSRSFLFGYLAPLMLPFCILIAIYIAKLFTKNFSKWDKVAVVIPMIVFGLLSIVGVVVIALPQVRDNIFTVAVLTIPIIVVPIFVIVRSIEALKSQCIKKIVVYFAIMMMVVANFGYGVGQYLGSRNVEVLAKDINVMLEKYPDAKVYTSHRFYEIGFYTKNIPTIINDEDELVYAKDFEGSGIEKYMMDYHGLINKWNTSGGVNFLVIKNSVLGTYKKSIKKDKFFILDKNSYATLVSSKKVSI
ncbi:glycosyltransferase family 39 protein [Francisellaceae bacterium CB299]|jgi:4-amino-4-deoxy-L-arabinose transferase-like glycosyltransferase